MTEELVRKFRGKIVFGPFAPVEPAEVARLEAEIGASLPATYRSFLEVANGGRLEYAVRVPPTPDGEVVSFAELYRVGRDDKGEYGYGTLVREFQARTSWWPAELTSVDRMLPIACDGGDDMLFMDVSAETHGRVLGFVRALPAWTGVTQSDVVSVLAESFEAYLDTVFVDPDAGEADWDEVRDLDAGHPRRRAVEEWLDQGLPGWRELPWALG